MGGGISTGGDAGRRLGVFSEVEEMTGIKE